MIISQIEIRRPPYGPGPIITRYSRDGFSCEIRSDSFDFCIWYTDAKGDIEVAGQIQRPYAHLGTMRKWSGSIRNNYTATGLGPYSVFERLTRELIRSNVMEA